VLIDLEAHHEVMFGYFLIAFLLIVGPLAYAFGVDSRLDERSRRDRYSG
jgi:hypothetical protein